MDVKLTILKVKQPVIAAESYSNLLIFGLIGRNSMNSEYLCTLQR